MGESDCLLVALGGVPKAHALPPCEAGRRQALGPMVSLRSHPGHCFPVSVWNSEEGALFPPWQQTQTAEASGRA